MRLRTVVVPVLALAACHKNVDKAAIATRELPGFSIALPAGKPALEQLDYSQGAVQLDAVAGTGNVVRVAWEPGRLFDDSEIMMIANGLGSKSSAKPEHGTGPHGVPTISLTVDTDKGPIRLVVTTCGARRIMIMASESESLARRMADSLACHPDAAKEASVDTVPWFVQLPAGWYSMPAPKGQLALTDGNNAVLARPIEHIKDRAEVPTLLEKLMGAAGMPMKVDAWNGTRYPLHATLEGKPYVGWAMPVDCGALTVLLMGFAADDAAADHLATVVAAGHCLAPGEKPEWPEPPKAEPPKP
ncbi:MAG: hypothetical protein JO257_09690 [Deltaproteobacteria bacterium]|nr:hypothetical protein [Deltaproteobacteria bacterium]